MYDRVAAHELMAPLIAADTRARLLAEQLHDRVDGSTRGELGDLIRILARTRLLSRHCSTMHARLANRLTGRR